MVFVGFLSLWKYRRRSHCRGTKSLPSRRSQSLRWNAIEDSLVEIDTNGHQPMVAYLVPLCPQQSCLDHSRLIASLVMLRLRNVVEAMQPFYFSRNCFLVIYKCVGCTEAILFLLDTKQKKIPKKNTTKVEIVQFNKHVSTCTHTKNTKFQKKPTDCRWKSWRKSLERTNYSSLLFQKIKFTRWWISSGRFTFV